MDHGGENRYLGSYLSALEEGRVLHQASPEEKQQLQAWRYEASQLAGKEWCDFSSRETTDKGVEQSACLMVQYRILLATIRLREAKNGQ